MLDFVKTRLTLLRKAASAQSAKSEAAWGRIFDMYYPSMVEFVRLMGGGVSADDVAQIVLVNLVDALRSGKYRIGESGSFRSYLKSMLKHELIDVWRSEMARRRTEVRAQENKPHAVPTQKLPNPDEALEAAWRIAQRNAAVQHVLTRTAIPERIKNIYRAYVLDGRSSDDVRKEFGITVVDLARIKYRVNRRIADVENYYGEE